MISIYIYFLNNLKTQYIIIPNTHLKLIINTILHVKSMHLIFYVFYIVNCMVDTQKNELLEGLNGHLTRRTFHDYFLWPYHSQDVFNMSLIIIKNIIIFF
jgi:hypothetical protein